MGAKDSALQPPQIVERGELADAVIVEAVGDRFLVIERGVSAS